jgi:uncharacterized protein (DUF1330 family)
MSAYYILTQTVTDLEKYAQEYIAKVIPFLVKYEALEGFLRDPDYQPIFKVRLSLTKNAHAVMAPEFRMPG